MRVKVDVSASTALGLCRCGARFLALSHERALERLAQHERRMHPEDDHAARALYGWRKRHADPEPE